MKMSRRVLRNM